MRSLSNKRQFCISVLIAAGLLAVLPGALAQPFKLAPGLVPGLGVLPQDPAFFNQQQLFIQQIESESGPYDIRLKESLGTLARGLEQTGEYLKARDAYNRILQISRINEGLYNASQVPIVEHLIRIEISLADWDAVDNRYGYLEHLYRKLYKTDDPRLEEGLKNVVAWHISASNTNLNGNRMEHLRKVYMLLRLRLQIAELTLGSGDPLFDYLKQNIARSEYYLYLSSDVSSDDFRRTSRVRREMVNNK